MNAVTNTTPAAARRLRPGDPIEPRTLTTIGGDRIALPDPSGLTHLQFRRFAGCPICNVHLASIARRHDEIRAAGIREVVVFHSPAEHMRPHQGRLPFAAIADPDKVLYAAFGVGSAARAVLHPSAWTAPLRPRTWAVVAKGVRAGGLPTPHGQTVLGLPADFLIGPDGTVWAVRYGRHAADHWSVDEILNEAAAASSRR
ncbi:peroxiredoxin-like family protein [Rhodococcus oryzae]|uniref:peroxiredoxin-like family protein n=1 Tax=Rhodococcus oryzae TaxID=2571143 RepID=UPI003716724D